MIKYTGAYITFQEVPDEVSLVLTISNCPGRCEGCHSPWLREDIGDDLEKDLLSLLEKYGDAITCVCFMGEGNDLDALRRCGNAVSVRGLKWAVYSGRDDIDPFVIGLPSYIKTGSYKKECGGLSSPSTNQHMYKWDATSHKYTDITHKFLDRRKD